MLHAREFKSDLAIADAYERVFEMMIIFMTVLEVYRTAYNWVVNTSLLIFIITSTLVCKLNVIEQPQRPETIVTTSVGLAVGVFLIALILRRFELNKR